MKKTLLCLCLLVSSNILYSINLNALYYESKIHARLSINNLEKKPIIDGFYKNNLEINNVLFVADVIVDDNDYLYDLSSNHKQAINLYSNLYTGYQINQDHKVYFGYLPSVGSNYFYYNYLDRYPSFFGIKGLKKFNLNRIDSNNGSMFPNKYYVITSAFSNNNSGLSAAYLGKLFDDKLNIGLSYTFDMNKSLRNYEQNIYKGFASPLDLNAAYYDEYLDFGYGIKASARRFLNNHNDNLLNEIGVSTIFDYFGASYQFSVLNGNNNIETYNNNTDLYKTPITYFIIENNVSYNISSFTFGVYYLSSVIKGKDFNYKTNLTEFNIKYQLSNYLHLAGNIFYQNTLVTGLSNFKADTGFVLGLVIDY